MYETGKRLKNRLQSASTKIDMGAYDLGAFRVGLEAMLHRTRVEQHAGFANTKPLLIRLDDIDTTLAQKVKVAGSVRVMITRYPAKLAAEKHLRREGEVPEDYRQRVHLESAYNATIRGGNAADETLGYANKTNRIVRSPESKIKISVHPKRGAQERRTNQ